MKQETLDFINCITKKGSVLGLSNMKQLMEKLGNVQDALPIIHIAGTNGKGSTGCYLSALFQQAGLSVGRYVSPAVFDRYEIITINDQPIAEADYESLMEEIRVVCLDLPKEEWPTLFEAETALAYLYFSRKSPEIVLVECGMGGETDATNVMCAPMASVITTISLDHIKFLGSTLSDIAQVKAGIIKENCPVFSATQEPLVSSVLLETAKEKNATIRFVDDSKLNLLEEKPGNMSFTYQRAVNSGCSECNNQFSLSTTMAGHYQMMNAALAIEVFLSVMPMAEYVAPGIAKAKWPGRFEVVSENPLIIMDGAHNEGAAMELEKTLINCFGEEKLTLVMGVLADKDHRRMLEILLPHAKRLVTITPQNNPRALEAELLADEARAVTTPEFEIFVAKTYAEALKNAKNNREHILICGSLSFLGEMRKEIVPLWN